MHDNDWAKLPFFFFSFDNKLDDKQEIPKDSMDERQTSNAFDLKVFWVFWKKKNWPWKPKKKKKATKFKTKITIFNANELQVFLSHSYHHSLALCCTNFANVQSCLIIHPRCLSLFHHFLWRVHFDILKWIWQTELCSKHMTSTIIYVSRTSNTIASLTNKQTLSFMLTTIHSFSLKTCHNKYRTWWSTTLNVCSIWNRLCLCFGSVLLNHLIHGEIWIYCSKQWANTELQVELHIKTIDFKANFSILLIHLRSLSLFLFPKQHLFVK